MSYVRVIPRDLFNESSLLKCYGRLYLNLETLNLPNVTIDNDGEAFDVTQCEDDGSLTLSNVVLTVRDFDCPLRRPLNSRAPWPLYLTRNDGDEIEVFDTEGNFTSEMFAFLEVTSNTGE